MPWPSFENIAMFYNSLRPASDTVDSFNDFKAAFMNIFCFLGYVTENVYAIVGPTIFLGFHNSDSDA